jgi:hypothetical protein
MVDPLSLTLYQSGVRARGPAPGGSAGRSRRAIEKEDHAQARGLPLLWAVRAGHPTPHPPHAHVPKWHALLQCATRVPKWHVPYPMCQNGTSST